MKINDKMANGLYLNVSTIPGAGIGLFTGLPLGPGVPVCQYKGTVFAPEDKEDVYRQYEYTLKSGFITKPLIYTLTHTHTKQFIDCHPAYCKAEMGLGGFVNDAKNWQNRISLEGLSGEEKTKAVLDAGYNLLFFALPNSPEFLLMSMRRINAGEELFVSYGDAYWDPFKEAAEAEKKRQENLVAEGEEKTKEKREEKKEDNEPVSA